MDFESRLGRELALTVRAGVVVEKIRFCLVGFVFQGDVSYQFNFRVTVRFVLKHSGFVDNNWTKVALQKMIFEIPV